MEKKENEHGRRRKGIDCKENKYKIPLIVFRFLMGSYLKRNFYFLIIEK